MTITFQWPANLVSDNIESVGPIGVRVRCFFEGGLDSPDPADFTLARVPVAGEDIDHADRIWRVTRVRWTPDGPMLSMSLLA